MTARSSTLLGACLLLAVCVFLPRSVRAREPSYELQESAVARAEEYVRRGTEAFEAGRMSEALAHHQQAWDIAKTFRTAVGAGQVELTLGMHRDAADHLAFALDRMPPDASDTLRQNVRAGLATAREHVATVDVAGAPEGAILSVSGRQVGVVPSTFPVHLEPGAREIVAKVDGRIVARADVHASAGQRLSVELAPSNGAPETSVARGADAPNVEVVPEEPSPSPAPDAAKDSVGLLPATWVLIVGGTATAGAVIASTAFGLVASSHDADAAVARKRAEAGGGCASVPASCDTLAASIEDRDAADRAALVSAIVAGGLGVATLTVAAILWPSSEDAPADVSVGPRVDGVSVTLSGRF